MLQNPEIQRLAASFRSITHSDEEYAVVVFQFVRDGFKFCFEHDWSNPEDVFMARGPANCSTKAEILVALLRAGGLKAKFGYSRVTVASLTKGLSPAWMFHFLKQPLGIHVVAVVLLNGRWVQLDASFDKPLLHVMTAFWPAFAEPVEFDGRSDYIPSQPVDLKKTKDVNFFLKLKGKDWSCFLDLFNSCINWARTQGWKNESVDEYIQSMEDYLVTDHSVRPLLEELRNLAISSGMHFPEHISQRMGYSVPEKQICVRGHSVPDFCSVFSPDVQRLVSTLRSSTKSDEEFAIAAFNWVRDEIKYVFMSDWSVPVDHTLATREGVCSTKSCLLTTLLSAGGLKAAFFITEINPVELFQYSGPLWLRGNFSTRSKHFMSAVFLNGRWLILDASIDRRLAECCRNSAPNPDDYKRFLVEFDGKSDAVAEGTYSGEITFVRFVDAQMAMKARIPASIITACNFCIEFSRQHAFNYYSLEALHEAMDIALRTHHPDVVQEIQNYKNPQEPLPSKL